MQVIHGIEFTPFTEYARSVLTVNATETSNYTCVAHNTVLGNTTHDKKTFTLAVVHPISRKLIFLSCIFVIILVWKIFKHTYLFLEIVDLFILFCLVFL